jgi:SAM-dependent methyltransferase
MSLPQSCPLCGASPARQSVVTGRVYGGGTGHAVHLCDDCDLRYLHPGLSAGDEREFYAKEFESFMSDRSAGSAGWEQPERHIKVNEEQRLRRMGHLASFLRGNKRVLEIGCSSGFMLYPLREQGHDCVGVEPSGVFSNYVRARGLQCFESLQDLQSSGITGSGFDFILHYYVLEHIADPLGFLKSQLAMLRPGGIILFEVPHAKDALTAIYDVAAYERFIWVVSHRWYFSRQSLTRLLTMVGGNSEVRFDQRYDLSNHLVWLRDGKPGGMARFTEKLGRTIEDQYRAALVAAGYGDTLIAILRRAE